MRNLNVILLKFKMIINNVLNYIQIVNKKIKKNKFLYGYKKQLKIYINNNQKIKVFNKMHIKKTNI